MISALPPDKQNCFEYILVILTNSNKHVSNHYSSQGKMEHRPLLISVFFMYLYTPDGPKKCL